MSSTSFNKLERFSGSLARWLNWVAGVGLIAMLVLVFIDIVAIKIFRWPIPAGIEIVGFLGVVVAAFAIAQTHVLGGHIRVEFFVTCFPKRVQAAMTTFVSLLGLVLFSLLAWQSYEFGHVLQTTGEVSMTGGIAFYYFVYAIAICSLSQCLVLIVELLRFAVRVASR